MSRLLFPPEPWIYSPEDDPRDAWKARVPGWPGPPIMDMPVGPDGKRQSSCCPGCPGGSDQRCCAFGNYVNRLGASPPEPYVIYVRRPLISISLAWPRRRATKSAGTATPRRKPRALCTRERLRVARRVLGLSLLSPGTRRSDVPSDTEEHE